MISLFIVLFLSLTFARGTQVAMYKERTSDQCGDSGGEGLISSAAACGAGAAVLGWGDTTASTLAWSNVPHGCFQNHDGDLYFNTRSVNVDCTSDKKCLCTLTCSPGTYQDQSGQYVCKTCAVGRYQAQSGQSSCKTCGTGKYNGQQGQSSCESCGTGKYNGQEGRISEASCNSCARGQFQENSGQSSCKTCGTGKYNGQQGGISEVSCKPCDAGKYNGQLGQSSCNSCAGGKYQDKSGQSSCKTCVQGNYSTVGASSCETCASGTYSTVGASSCANSCPVGTYDNGTASCDSCDPGKYNDQLGQSSCKSCGTGKYNDQPGQTSESSCKAIKFDAQTAIYKERTSGQCGDSGGGWGKITSETACEAGAAALGWGDTTASTGSYSDFYPTGCFFYSLNLYFKTGGPDYACSSYEKCLCTLTCQPGTYQDESGQSSCKTCASGTYNIAGASSCHLTATTCPVGTYASGTTTVCDSCSTGKYNDQQGQSSCKLCDAGKSNGQTGQSSCKTCASGQYQDQSGKNSCKTCTSGTYSTVGASSCPYSATTCPAGTYASGTATCESCGTGKYSSQQGQTSESSCKPCDAGKYNDKTSESSCNSCGTGKYNDQQGQSSCKSCGTGKYNGQQGQSSCTPCGTGKYSDKQGQTSGGTCLICARGQFQEQTGQTSCKTCASGQYQDESGQSSCKTCASGTYSTVGAPSCTVSCLYGTFVISGTASCDSCPTGKYNDQLGQSSCKLCDAGKYNDQLGQTSEAGACKSCGAGEYQNEVGKASCNSNCASWKVLTLDARCINNRVYKVRTSGVCGDSGGGWGKITSDKYACQYGAVALGWGDTTAVKWPSSGRPHGCQQVTQLDGIQYLYFNNYNTNEPCSGNYKCLCTLVCPSGTYQDKSGQSTCKTCANGKYSTVGASSCTTACSAGTYISGTASCDSCPSGTYSTVGAAACTAACPAGTYISGTASCDSCPSGKYNIVGTAACPTVCPAGTYLISGTASCDSCSTGQYQNQNAQLGCKTCPTGQFQDQVGQIICNECDLGQYSDIAGLISCKKCELGTYFISATSPCKSCPLARYSNSEITSAAGCKSCQVGQYTRVSQGGCLLCGYGKYSDEFSASSKNFCKDCPSGFEASRGQSVCTSIVCDEGKYYTGDTCRSCPSGQYQDQYSVETQCKNCSSHKVTQVVNGATSCDHECEDGYKGGGAFCEKCPQKYFLKHSQHELCQSCHALNPDTPHSDGSKCYKCLPGHAPLLQCEICPVGTSISWTSDNNAECNTCSLYVDQVLTAAELLNRGYQDEIGQETCKDCPVGRFISKDRTKCVACPFAKYSDVENLIECKTCNQNTQINDCPVQNMYGPNSHTASDGKNYYGYESTLDDVSAGVHKKFPTSCTAGKYKNVFDNTACKVCPAGLYKKKDVTGAKIIGPRDFDPCKLCEAGKAAQNNICVSCNKAYMLQTSGSCTRPIQTSTECESAAKYLGIQNLYTQNSQYDRNTIVDGFTQRDIKDDEARGKGCYLLGPAYDFDNNNRILENGHEPARLHYANPSSQSIYKVQKCGAKFPCICRRGDKTDIDPNKSVRKDLTSQNCLFKTCTNGKYAMNSACFDCPVGRYEADGIGVEFNKDAKTVWVEVHNQNQNAFTEDVRGERGILNDCEQFTYQFATTESDNFRSQLKNECEEGYTSGIQKDYVTDTGHCVNSSVWAEGYETMAEKNLFRELTCEQGFVVACTASGCYCSRLRRDCDPSDWRSLEGDVTYDKSKYYSKTSGRCEWPIQSYQDCQEATYHTWKWQREGEPEYHTAQIANDVRNNLFSDRAIGCTVKESYWPSGYYSDPYLANYDEPYFLSTNIETEDISFNNYYNPIDTCDPGEMDNRCFCNSRSPQQKMLLIANDYGVRLRNSRTIYDNLCHACPEGQIQNTPGETACVKT